MRVTDYKIIVLVKLHIFMLESSEPAAKNLESGEKFKLRTDPINPERIKTSAFCFEFQILINVS